MLTGLIPIGDDNEDRIQTPYVTYTLVVINILVYVFLQGLGGNNAFTYGYSVVPIEILQSVDLEGKTPGGIPHFPGPNPIYLTLLTAMFMHGGFMHILGNMAYLWIFGDNVEGALGHAKFLIFYLLCGFIATGAHIISTVVFRENPYIPSLGASGAIAGVLGGYLVMFPTRRIKVLMINIIIGIIHLPAVVVIGFWALLQFFNGFGSIARTSETSGGGVAYMAHIGGFVAGVVLVSLFRNPQVQQRIDQRTAYPMDQNLWRR